MRKIDRVKQRFVEEGLEIAKSLLNRFEFIFIPKHGSWLNMAEIELNVLMGQCLNRRIDSMEKIEKEIKAMGKCEK